MIQPIFRQISSALSDSINSIESYFASPQPEINHITDNYQKSSPQFLTPRFSAGTFLLLFAGCESSSKNDTAEITCEQTYYRDEDGDGYGVTSESVEKCYFPENYSTLGGDCNDDRRNTNPGEASYLHDCSGYDDAVFEPNEDAETATPLACGEEFHGALDTDDDQDWYLLDAIEPTLLDVRQFSSEQDIAGYLYDSTGAVGADDVLVPPIYLKVTFDFGSGGLSEGDRSYSLQLSCDTCDEGVPVEPVCEGYTVVTYDECGNILDTDECIEGQERCKDGACCDDTDDYACEYWNDIERWVITYTDECEGIEGAAWEYCDEDERCGWYEGEMICSDIF